MAINSFKNKASEDICREAETKAARSCLPVVLHQKARLKLAVLAAATSLNDLREIRSNRLEPLKGDRKGQFSMRINDQYRICFRWVGNNAEDVEIVDYH